MAGSGPLSHAKDIQPIWDASCVTHCHSRDPQTVPDAGLELWPDGYPAIINVPSK
ncbi:MAG: hypothetical protein MJD61_11165 [Proteobacteria bacterium]|nr:hypothetical protein [Pseudomonadota bacterium]